MNKRLYVAVLVLVAVAAAGFAQQLSVSQSGVKIDGTVTDKEYALTLPLGRMTVYLNRTADTLDMAITAPTTGWVALGFGSDRMDGASLFLGTVQDGKAALSQQRGVGHGHREVSAPLAVDYAMTEDKGSTTLEMAFKAADAISAGQRQLMVLAAYGSSDTITAYHTARDRVTVSLQ
jgi:hypothetical protein